MRKVCSLVLVLMVCCSVVYAEEQVTYFRYIDNSLNPTAGVEANKIGFTLYAADSRYTNVQLYTPATPAQLYMVRQKLAEYGSNYGINYGDMFVVTILDSVTRKGISITVHYIVAFQFSYCTFSFISRR